MKIRSLVAIAAAASLLFAVPASAGVIKNIKKAVVHACDKAQDKTAGTGLAAKKVVTGKQSKTFVQGYYKQNDTHVKGHYRQLTNPVSGPSLAAKAKKVAVKTGDRVQNKVMDTGVGAVAKVTGKKPKTFVTGHYTSNGSHVNGHFRKVGGK